MRIGVDLGGTKIEVAALDDQGEIACRKRAPTPAGDYPGTLDTIVQLVHATELQIGQLASIGVGTPGSISPTKDIIRNANSVCLNGQPLQQDLEQLLKRPVRMANDADCFTLSESVDGAARGMNCVFGVIIGTGTGGGISVGGRLISGPNSVAGEWGHNPLPWPQPDEIPGPHCYCGKSGCIETFLSGPGLSRDYATASGKAATPEEILANANAGDECSSQILARYEERMARGLASIINVLDPDCIVLGGGLSNLQRLYVNVPKLWSKFVFSDAVTTRLLPPAHGDSSGVRGAAWLWPA